MAEYIERKDVIDTIENFIEMDKYYHPYSRGKIIPIPEMVSRVNDIPAADVQPVVHGKWIPRILPLNKEGNECSACLAISVGAMKPYYCPNCGAKMSSS